MTENDTSRRDLDRCPLCGKELEPGEHYASFPKSPHTYHTDEEWIAKLWRYRAGLETVPEPEPYEEGTWAHRKYIDS